MSSAAAIIHTSCLDGDGVRFSLISSTILLIFVIIIIYISFIQFFFLSCSCTAQYIFLKDEIIYLRGDAKKKHGIINYLFLQKKLIKRKQSIYTHNTAKYHS